MTFIDVKSPGDAGRALESADIRLATTLARHRKHPAMRVA
jgi:hypothetical protein